MKILASDYDGTYRYEPKVTKEDLDAVKRWQKEGNLFVMVTGRSMESFTKEIEVNGFHCDYIIANNGGVIYDGDMNQMKVSYMDFEQALLLILDGAVLQAMELRHMDGAEMFTRHANLE